MTGNSAEKKEHPKAVTDVLNKDKSRKQSKERREKHP